MSKIFIITPVYNEELNIPTLCKSFDLLSQDLAGQFDVRFILVDDGSVDDTVKVAMAHAVDLNLEIIVHGNNMGPGAAFSSGFASLADRLQDDDWVITMEGDNTSRHELIKRMLTRAEEGFDVILASPYMYGGGFSNTSLLRQFLSGAANLLVKDLLDIRGILTVSSFFRAFRGRVILQMQHIFGAGIVERYGFESMVELVMKMTMLELSISEIAMRLDSSRRQGKSKMKILRTIRGYLILLFRKSKWQRLVLER